VRPFRVWGIPETGRFAMECGTCRPPKGCHFFCESTKSGTVCGLCRVLQETDETPGETLLEEGGQKSRRFLAGRPVLSWGEPTRSLQRSSALSANGRDDAFAPGLQLEGSHSNLYELGSGK
jgi:hypothetical protein